MTLSPSWASLLTSTPVHWNVLLGWVAAQRPMTITQLVSPSWASILTATHPTGIANERAKLDSSSRPSHLCHHMYAASSPYSQWTIILQSPQLLKPKLENHHHLPLPFPQNLHAGGHQVLSVLLFNLKSAHSSPSSLPSSGPHHLYCSYVICCN